MFNKLNKIFVLSMFSHMYSVRWSYALPVSESRNKTVLNIRHPGDKRVIVLVKITEQKLKDIDLQDIIRDPSIIFSLTSKARDRSIELFLIRLTKELMISTKSFGEVMRALLLRFDLQKSNDQLFKNIFEIFLSKADEKNWAIDIFKDEKIKKIIKKINAKYNHHDSIEKIHIILNNLITDNQNHKEILYHIIPLYITYIGKKLNLKISPDDIENLIKYYQKAILLEHYSDQNNLDHITIVVALKNELLVFKKDRDPEEFGQYQFQINPSDLIIFDRIRAQPSFETLTNQQKQEYIIDELTSESDRIAKLIEFESNIQVRLGLYETIKHPTKRTRISFHNILDSNYQLEYQVLHEGALNSEEEFELFHDETDSEAAQLDGNILVTAAEMRVSLNPRNGLLISVLRLSIIQHSDIPVRLSFHNFHRLFELLFKPKLLALKDVPPSVIKKDASSELPALLLSRFNRKLKNRYPDNLQSSADTNALSNILTLPFLIDDEKDWIIDIFSEQSIQKIINTIAEYEDYNSIAKIHIILNHLIAKNQVYKKILHYIIPLFVNHIVKKLNLKISDLSHIDNLIKYYQKAILLEHYCDKGDIDDTARIFICLNIDNESVRFTKDRDDECMQYQFKIHLLDLEIFDTIMPLFPQLIDEQKKEILQYIVGVLTQSNLIAISKDYEEKIRSILKQYQIKSQSLKKGKQAKNFSIDILTYIGEILDESVFDATEESHLFELSDSDEDEDTAQQDNSSPSVLPLATLKRDTRFFNILRLLQFALPYIALTYLYGLKKPGKSYEVGQIDDIPILYNWELLDEVGNPQTLASKTKYPGSVVISKHSSNATSGSSYCVLRPNCFASDKTDILNIVGDSGNQHDSCESDVDLFENASQRNDDILLEQSPDVAEAEAEPQLQLPPVNQSDAEDNKNQVQCLELERLIVKFPNDTAAPLPLKINAGSDNSDNKYRSCDGGLFENASEQGNEVLLAQSQDVAEAEAEPQLRLPPVNQSDAEDNKNQVQCLELERLIVKFPNDTAAPLPLKINAGSDNSDNKYRSCDGGLFENASEQGNEVLLAQSPDVAEAEAEAEPQLQLPPVNELNTNNTHISIMLGFAYLFAMGIYQVLRSNTKQNQNATQPTLPTLLESAKGLVQPVDDKQKPATITNKSPVINNNVLEAQNQSNNSAQRQSNDVPQQQPYSPQINQSNIDNKIDIPTLLIFASLTIMLMITTYTILVVLLVLLINYFTLTGMFCLLLVCTGISLLFKLLYSRKKI